ncbi:MAG: hypothetical protein ABIG96_04710 [Candidatus Micrarchaeota archaeon]
MPIISSIAAAFRAFGRKTKGTTKETYLFDRKKGAVELRIDPRLNIKLEMFKRFTQKRTWGVELTIRNKGDATLDELLIIFNKKFSIIFDRIKPDAMKIKSLEFKHEEFDSDEFMVDLSLVETRNRQPYSEAYSLTLPMSTILRELKELGKIIPIQEEEETFKPGTMDKSIVDEFVAESMKQASIKPRVVVQEAGKAANTKDQLMKRLGELENQKTEITKSFMKREIDYGTLSQLMNPIVQEIILTKAQISKLEN